MHFCVMYVGLWESVFVGICLSMIANNELDKEIQKIKEDHPAAGEVMIFGHLSSRPVPTSSRKSASS